MLGEKAAKYGKRHFLSLTAERNTRVDSRMRNASLFKYLSTQIPKFVVMCPFCSTRFSKQRVCYGLQRNIGSFGVAKPQWTNKM